MAPKINPDDLTQIPAFPLGSWLKTDPWDDKVHLLNARRYAPMNARDKMPFEVTPVFFKLIRYDVSKLGPGAAVPTDDATTPATTTPAAAPTAPAATTPATTTPTTTPDTTTPPTSEYATIFLPVRHPSAGNYYSRLFCFPIQQSSNRNIYPDKKYEIRQSNSCLRQSKYVKLLLLYCTPQE